MKWVLKITPLFFLVNAYAQFSKLEFIENKKQWDEKIHFKAKIPGGDLYVEKDRLTYLFYDEQDISRLNDLHHNAIQDPKEKDYLLDLHALQVGFLGANLASFSSNKKKRDYVNYFLGNDTTTWASNVNKYEEIRYNDLYDNIDLKLYLSGDHLKYDFIVAPGGDVEAIKFKYKGSSKIELEEGALQILTSLNSIIEERPYAYQIIKGKRKEVKCRFQLEGNTVSFAFPRGYNRKYNLIIDPALVFSSYSGSTEDNWGYTATYDEAGNLYAGGVIFGVGYPTTLGAYQVNFNGGDGNYKVGTDISLSKFSAKGTSLLYSTYIGGEGNESPHSLVVNGKNELLILGTTSSQDYPTSNAYDASFNGGVSYTESVPNYVNGSDIIVSKLSDDGSLLLGSTFIGGSGNDGLNVNPTLKYNYADDYRGEIIVDADNNIYVASTTMSTDFPTPGNTVQTVNMGGQEGCVFKLSDDLSTLIWGTYIGGPAADAMYAVQLDELDNVVATGGTLSTTFPNYQGGADGLILKMDNDGKNVLASTCVGTQKYDQSFFVQMDASNNIYVVGQTEGSYPITPKTVYNQPHGGQFLHKFSPDLKTTIFSTVFGRPGGVVDSATVDIALSAFLVNDCDRIFISGWGGNTNSDNGGPSFSTTTDLPVTSDAIQSSTDGSDYYLMVLDENANDLVFATFFGGNSSSDHVDGGTSRFDKRGIVYQAVCASCGTATSDFPTTSEAWSDLNNSDNCNIGVFKIDLSFLTSTIDVSPESSFCLGDTVFFLNLSNGGKTFQWDFGDGFSSTEKEPDHIYATSGEYTVTMIATDSLSCILTDTVYININIHPAANVSIEPVPGACEGDTIQLMAEGGEKYAWQPSTNISNDTISDPVAIVDKTITYAVEITDSFNCKSELSVDVEVVPAPLLDLGPDIELKWGGKGIGLEPNTTGVFYQWKPSEGLSCTDCLNPVANPQETTTYVLLVQDTTGCYNSDTITIFIDGSIYLPSSFSPNGDGVNDVFYALGKNIVEMELFVFNRWGQRIFYTDDIRVGWDGKYKNKLSEVETYVWTLKYKDSFGKKGSMNGRVTLVL